MGSPLGRDVTRRRAVATAIALRAQGDTAQRLLAHVLRLDLAYDAEIMDAETAARTPGAGNQFGGMKPDDAKRLEGLERENATLKRLLANARSTTPHGL